MKAEPEPVQMMWSDAARDSVKDLTDVAIERIFRFLAKGKTYSLAIKPDPVNSGKIWAISLSDGVSDLHIAFVQEGSYLSAVKVVKYISMLLQVFGYDISDSSSEDFTYTSEEKAYSDSFEKIKISVHLDLSIGSSTVFKSFYFACKTQDAEFIVAEVGGMTYDSAHILCFQFCILLSALGKQIVCPDGSTMNQYGVAEISPDNEKYQHWSPNLWIKAANSIQHISLSKRIFDRIDLPSSAKKITLLSSSKYVLHSTPYSINICDSTSDDPTMPYKPTELTMSAIEREAYNEPEAESLIKDSVKRFIGMFGFVGMRAQIVKRHFLSSGKTCIGIVIEDMPLNLSAVEGMRLFPPKRGRGDRYRCMGISNRVDCHWENTHEQDFLKFPVFAASFFDASGSFDDPQDPEIEEDEDFDDEDFDDDFDDDEDEEEGSMGFFFGMNDDDDPEDDDDDFGGTDEDEDY